MKILKSVLKRLLISGVPFILLYFYSQFAIAANMQREHRTDVGLGIAFLFFFIMIILFIGFMVDLLQRLRRKEYQIAMTDVPFLLAFLFLILYIGCLMTSRACFCNWMIDFGRIFLPF